MGGPPEHHYMFPSLLIGSGIKGLKGYSPYINITMPNAQVTSALWFIRVTKPHLALIADLHRKDVTLSEGKLVTTTSVDKLAHWLVDSKRFLCVTHIGEKTEKEHVHILLELSQPLQKQTVDKRFKRACDVAGPNYSSKLWDGDMGSGAGSYLFHDPTATIIANVGFSDDEIKRFQELNREVQKVVEINKQRASGRCVDRVLQCITDSGRNWTRTEIAHKLLTDIKEGVMYEPGDYVLKRYLEEIYAKQLKTDDWNKYASIRVGNLVRMDDVEISFAK